MLCIKPLKGRGREEYPFVCAVAHCDHANNIYHAAFLMVSEIIIWFISLTGTHTYGNITNHIRNSCNPPPFSSIRQIGIEHFGGQGSTMMGITLFVTLFIVVARTHSYLAVSDTLILLILHVLLRPTTLLTTATRSQMALRGRAEGTVSPQHTCSEH